MRRTLVHHATCHAPEVGRGRSVDAAEAEMIDSAIGMANDATETANPVRERADHRWARSSRCPDTGRSLRMQNVENLKIEEKLSNVTAI